LLDGSHKPAPSDQTQDDADPVRMRVIARSVWEKAEIGAGSPLERWFKVRRITLPVPSCLRWAPHCKYPDGTCWPALIARVDDADGQFIGIRRTYLAPDLTAKAPVPPGQERLSLGLIRGGAVRLAPLRGEHLLIGECIETCLSAMEVSGLPVWAAGDTSGLKNLCLPSVVRRVTILADNDSDPRRGPAAARAAAERWTRKGLWVRIAWPPLGLDFNDEWSGRAAVAR
jgi:hypothetical protein